MNWLKSIGASFRRNAAFLAILALAMFAMSARADTDVTSLVTDATTVWTAVKTLVLAIVGFIILIAVVKLVKKR